MYCLLHAALGGSCARARLPLAGWRAEKKKMGVVGVPTPSTCMRPDGQLRDRRLHMRALYAATAQQLFSRPTTTISTFNYYDSREAGRFDVVHTGGVW